MSPPRLLRKADAVLAGDRSLPGEDLGEKRVERSLRSSLNGRILGILDHDIHMNVAIPRMAEAGEGESVFLLEARGEFHEVH